MTDKAHRVQLKYAKENKKRIGELLTDITRFPSEEQHFHRCLWLVAPEQVKLRFKTVINAVR